MITEEAASSDSKERVLLYDLWKLLKGEEKEEINMEDVRMMILAILRINEHKRIGISNPIERASQSKEGLADVGFFNDKG